MATFCCPIEMEPRTLNEGQINLAREVAEYIVQKKEPNEASGIFIEGLKPVVAIKEMTQLVQNQKGDCLDIGNCKEKLAAGISETSCQCICASAIVESPDQAAKLKEPLSAPF